MKSKIYQFDQWLFVLFNCRLLHSHKWTVKDGFKECKIYCIYCGYISKYSKDLIKKGYGKTKVLQMGK